MLFFGIVLSPYWTNLFSVSFLLMTSESFLWVLYLRFTAVCPLKVRWLTTAALTWMILESCTVLAVGASWATAAIMGNQTQKAYAASIYAWLSIVQAATACFLSGYFVFSFYMPRLTGLQSKKMFVVGLYSTGLLYLVLEVCLYSFSAPFRNSEN